MNEVVLVHVQMFLQTLLGRKTSSAMVTLKWFGVSATASNVSQLVLFQSIFCWQHLATDITRMPMGFQHVVPKLCLRYEDL